MVLAIMTGNIGSGKSLFAGKLARRGYVRVNNDEITTMVQGGEYGAYDPAKKDVYRAIELAGVDSALNAGLDVVVDRTNMKVSDRERYISIGKKYGAKIISYDFGPGTQKGLDRRQSEPNGISSNVWANVWENFFSKYASPNLSEGFDEVRTPPTSYTTFAFDFDGTICDSDFPGCGEPIQKTIREMCSLSKDLSNIIIVWTCRSGDSLAVMKKWLIDNRVPFDFINKNPVFDTGSRKIFAHHYVDDRSLSL